MPQPVQASQLGWQIQDYKGEVEYLQVQLVPIIDFTYPKPKLQFSLIIELTQSSWYIFYEFTCIFLAYV